MGDGRWKEAQRPIGVARIAHRAFLGIIEPTRPRLLIEEGESFPGARDHLDLRFAICDLRFTRCDKRVKGGLTFEDGSPQQTPPTCDRSVTGL
jgi:hypothetical protein